MIMVRGGSAAPFEAAYFIMKSSPEHDQLGENDMASEAGRIIAENSVDRDRSDAVGSKGERKLERARRIIAFCLGLVLGGAGASFLIAVLR
jgi:hypothetical protein